MTSIQSNGYSISISSEIFKTISAFLNKSSYSSFFILCDENTLQHCLPKLITSCPKLQSAEILEIESGESSKTLQFSTHIWQTFIENKADKNTLLINLGGGVVSDLGGFTASVYKRGIDFINIPTSLLAMADASVGGKTGLDLGGIKNVIGTFAQPKAVFIYPDYLHTLSSRHFQNGLAEIYKIALISDKKFWDLFKEEGQNIETLIIKSIRLKNKIVLNDPYDKNVRKTLNFGHTIGHALEALFLETRKELLHGEAIIIGMLMESHIAYQKKMILKKELLEIVSVIQPYFTMQAIEDDVSFEAMISLIQNDKKSSKDKFYFSLIDKIGSCKFDVVVTKSQIKKALDFYATLSR